jgi:hypothetical protein
LLSFARYARDWCGLISSGEATPPLQTLRFMDELLGQLIPSFRILKHVDRLAPRTSWRKGTMTRLSIEAQRPSHASSSHEHPGVLCRANWLQLSAILLLQCRFIYGLPPASSSRIPPF